MLNLLKDLKLYQDLPIVMYDDNTTCIKLSGNYKHQARVKHIDIKFHNVKHLKEKGVITLSFITAHPKG